jgi:hypothetical protein
LGGIPTDYTPTLGVLVMVVLFWLNNCGLHSNIGLTFSLSIIKSMNLSSPASTKNDNIEDDDVVPPTEETGDDNVPPTEEKGDDDTNKNTSGDDVQADEKTVNSREIDLMQDNIMKQLKKEAYKERWGEGCGYGSASTNIDRVQKEDEDVSVGKDQDNDDTEDEDKYDNADEDDNGDEDEDEN